MQQGEQNAEPENLHELKLPREKKGRTLFLPIKQFWLGIKRISSENLQPSAASQMLHPPNITNTTSVKRSIGSRVFSLRAEGSIWLVPLKRFDPWERREVPSIPLPEGPELAGFLHYLVSSITSVLSIVSCQPTEPLNTERVNASRVVSIPHAIS